MISTTFNDGFYYAHENTAGVYCCVIPLVSRNKLESPETKTRIADLSIDVPAFVAPGEILSLDTHDFVLYARCADGNIYAWDLLESDENGKNRSASFVYRDFPQQNTRIVLHQKYMVVCFQNNGDAFYLVCNAKEPTPISRIGPFTYECKMSECCFGKSIFIATSTANGGCYDLDTGKQLYAVPNVDSNVTPVAYFDVLFYAPMPTSRLFTRVLRPSGKYRWVYINPNSPNEELNPNEFSTTQVCSIHADLGKAYMVFDAGDDDDPHEDGVLTVYNILDIAVYSGYLHTAIARVVGFPDVRHKAGELSNLFVDKIVKVSARQSGGNNYEMQAFYTFFPVDSYRTVIYRDLIISPNESYQSLEITQRGFAHQTTNFEALAHMNSKVQGNFIALWGTQVDWQFMYLYRLDLNAYIPDDNFETEIRMITAELDVALQGMASTSDETVKTSFDKVENVILSLKPFFNPEIIARTCIQNPGTRKYNASYLVLYVLSSHEPKTYLPMLYKVMNESYSRNQRDKIMKDIDGIEFGLRRFVQRVDDGIQRQVDNDARGIINKFLGF